MKFAESIDSSFHEAIVDLLIGLISILLCLRGDLEPYEVGTNFADKRRSLGRYSWLAD
jgi:hypothetical protein